MSDELFMCSIELINPHSSVVRTGENRGNLTGRRADQEDASPPKLTLMTEGLPRSRSQGLKGYIYS